jgi:hypothetical protein
MIIDRNSRPWIVAILAIFVAATAYYLYYAAHAPEGPRGSSVPGLVYASVGSAMMLFAMLLSFRKRFRTLRIGRTFWWTQGHVWLGLLSYPIIIYHAGGLHWGGTLTQVIMWLFTVIVISGIVGIVLQNYIPRSMLRDVQMETIFEQIGHVTEQLQGEARTIVQTVSRRPEREAFAVEVVPAGGGTALLAAEQSVDGAAILTAFYEQDVKPFLVEKVPKDSPLLTQQGFEAAFAVTKQALPQTLHQTLADLQSIVEERRQIEKQRRLHIALHCWLLVHVPLSFALLVLATAHAVYALRYT